MPEQDGDRQQPPEEADGRQPEVADGGAGLTSGAGSSEDPEASAAAEPPAEEADKADTTDDADTDDADAADSDAADSDAADSDAADSDAADSDAADSDLDDDQSPTSRRERAWAAMSSPRGRRTTRILLRIVVAIVGGLVGILLGASTTAAIGPVTANMSLAMFGGGAEIAIPPLGSLDVDAYSGPLSLRVELASVDERQAAALVRDPRHLQGLEERVVHDLRAALTWLVIKSTVCALIGAGLLALLTFRRIRDTLVAAAVCLVLLMGSAGLGVATWRPQALEEPTYTGLLSKAPTLVGDVRNLVSRFSDYRASLTKMVGNISKLYVAVSTLPTDAGSGDDTIRLLHVSDIHLNPTAFDLIAQLVNQFDIQAVLDTGDIVDWGSQPESTFVNPIGKLGVPYVYIRGNHDSTSTAQQVASQPNAIVLENSSTTVAGIDVVGIGDPRFSPDKSDESNTDASLVKATGQKLADYVKTLPNPPNIAMVHDPTSATALAGEVPLVLAGHTHRRKVSDLGKDTLLMTEGSTGGAGLRGLEHEEPTPLAATVLYFDKDTKLLTAYDEITLGGLGQTEVTIQRHVVDSNTGAEAGGTAPAGSATPTDTPTPTPVPATPVGPGG